MSKMAGRLLEDRRSRLNTLDLVGGAVGGAWFQYVETHFADFGDFVPNVPNFGVNV